MVKTRKQNASRLSSKIMDITMMYSLTYWALA